MLSNIGKSYLKFYTAVILVYGCVRRFIQQKFLIKSIFSSYHANFAGITPDLKVYPE